MRTMMPTSKLRERVSPALSEAALHFVSHPSPHGIFRFALFVFFY